jgi:hypothetical protein
MDAAQQEGFEPYRAVSKAAVISLALGLLSAIGFLSPSFLILALLGAVMGFLGYRAILQYPEELTGMPIAMVGFGLCSLIFVGGVAKHAHEYATEVPDGCLRITFADLQPDKKSPLPIPPSALELNDQQIFVKGYVYPDGQQYNIQRFVLVPDMGTCCFGGQPKLTDMIEVTLEDPLRIEYSYKKRKLAGVLKVDTRTKPVDGLGGVYYQLTADYRK